jgi:hypothetical protein
MFIGCSYLVIVFTLTGLAYTPRVAIIDPKKYT